MKKFKPEKMFSAAANKWWNSLSAVQKQSVLKQYAQIREKNKTSKHKFPDMRNLEGINIKEFTNKDIFCVYRFNGRYSL